MTGGPRTSLAQDDLLEAAPDDWAIAAPAGSESRRWLTLLTAGLRDEARLSAFGQYLTRVDLLRSAKAIAALATTTGARPRPMAEPPPRVVVIGGLPRTATTLLHTLAAESAGCWVPRTWEYDHPALIGTTDDEARRQAEAASTQRLAAFARVAPDFDAIHPMAATAPEECDLLLSHCFESFRVLLQYDLPTYRAMWLDSDHSHAYDLLAATLQRATHPLADGGAPRLPVLKAPGHLHAYETLRRHLPGAVIVQIHRPVSEVLTSWVDLIRSARSAFSTAVAPREHLLAEWLAVFSAMVDRGLAARAASPPGWIGLHYDEVAADPGGAWGTLLDSLEAPVPSGGAPTIAVSSQRVDHEYERVVPRHLTAAIAELDERYRHLVFGH